MVKPIKTTGANQASKKYAKTGIILAAVIAVAGLGFWGISSLTRTVSTERAIANVSSDAVNMADLRVAIIRMDAIQNDAAVIASLRKQKESFEIKLRDELTREQKALEKEKADIEKSQEMLSREALQRRVSDYQNRVGKLQRDLNERAQSIEMSFQKALNEIQTKHLDPIIDGIIAKKNLSIVMDGRLTRISNEVSNLDITSEIVGALDKKISNIKMDKPAGF